MEDRTCGTTSGKPPPKSLGPEVIEHKKKRKNQEWETEREAKQTELK